MILSYYIVILIFMTTVSVPLSAELLETLDSLVAQGVDETRAAVMRRGLISIARAEAIQRVLRAQKEPSLRGDLRELMKAID